MFIIKSRKGLVGLLEWFTIVICFVVDWKESENELSEYLYIFEKKGKWTRVTYEINLMSFSIFQTQKTIRYGW